MTIDEKYKQIWDSLDDSQYRHQFVEEEINVGIAFQIRSLRNREEMTQTKLADKMNIKQPLLSAWENPQYGKYNLKTLKELAKVFDVGLLVRFVPFSEMVDHAVNMTNTQMTPPSFTSERTGNRAAAAAVQEVPADIVNYINNITMPSTTVADQELIPVKKEMAYATA